MTPKEFGQELCASLIIIICIVMVIAITYVMGNELFIKWFIISFIAIAVSVVVLTMMNNHFKSRILDLIIKTLSLPINVIFATLIVTFPFIALLIHIAIYFGIAFLIPALLRLVFDFFNLIEFLRLPTLAYIQITLGVFTIVLLNSLIRRLTYEISPLRIKSSKKLKPYEFDKLTDYLLSSSNIKYLVYLAYFFVLIIINFQNFQNFNDNENNKVLLQSFITFIAFDRSLVLLKQLNFSPSIFLLKIIMSISNKANQLDPIILSNNQINEDMPKTLPSQQMYEEYKRPHWMKRHSSIIITSIVGISLMNIIFIAKAFRETDTINVAAAGLLGDFVGGYIGTFFALISIVLLLLTLQSQRNSTAIQAFETKYFELIKMHRDNVSEIGIGKDFGKKIFVMMIREYRCILEVLDGLLKKHNLDITKEERLIIAYNTLFYGVGPNSSRMLLSSLSEYSSVFIDDLEKTLNNKETKNFYRSQRSFRFTPFEGHQSRLGHYYRHLYQTVSYVDKQKLDIDKYEFVKTIRAQLTTHEQALLFLNSLTSFGHDWWDKGLITRYRIVQNIPRNFFNPENEVDLELYFRKDYFEWQEAHTTGSLTSPRL